MKKPIGKWVMFKFLDHSQSDDTSVENELDRPEIYIELCGKIIMERDDIYVVEVVSCPVPGNSMVWQIIKSTIKEMKVISAKRV